MGLKLGIILARGGSKGVPRKNLIDFFGKPLIEFTIDHALAAKSLDMVVVSTEDKEIAEISRRYGLKVIERPDEYATDSAPIDFALRHAVHEIEKSGNEMDIVVVLYGNVPIRREGIVDKAIDKLLKSKAHSVQTYAKYPVPPQWAYRIKDDKVELLDKEFENAYRRQLLEPAYYPDGAAIALRRDILMKNEDSNLKCDIMGADRRAIIQQPEDTVDIDEPVDLLWAEFLLEKRNRNSLLETYDENIDCKSTNKA